MVDIIPGVKEALVGSFLEAILYGFYLDVSLKCVKVLRQKHKSRTSHLYLTITFVLLFIFITMRAIIDIERVIYGVMHPDEDGAVSFGTIDTIKSVLTNAFWIAATVISDTFIIYRVYVVWRKSVYSIVLPILLYMGSLGGGIWAIQAETAFDPNSPAAAIFGTQVAKAFNTFLYFTLALNIVCTGLISFKIWNVRKNVSGARQGMDSFDRLIAVIVESAAIYTILLIIQIVTNATGNFVNFIFLDMTPPTIGIVFSNLIVRVSQGVTHGDTATGPSTGRTQNRVYELRSRMDDEGGRINTDGVEIRLQTVTQTHIDGDSEHALDESDDKDGPLREYKTTGSAV